MSDFRPVVVVPVYRHGEAFRDMLPALAQHGLPIIVVDDGSDRATADVLDQLVKDHPLLEMQRHPVNRGKGAAVITGLRKAAERRFTHVLQIDGDGQHDTADIPEMLARAIERPDAVILGKPEFDSSMPKSRHYARYLTHVWIWIETLSLEIRDSMCGFRIYPLERIMPLLTRRVLGQRMDFDPEILVRLHWRGVPMISVPTAVVYPERGRSNFKLLDDNLLISLMHTRLFFGMLLRLPMLLGRRLF